MSDHTIVIIWIVKIFVHSSVYFCHLFLISSASVQFISLQFSCSVVSDSLRPHESQHAKPPCPSPTPRVHSDSRSSGQWCHPAISSSVVPFFSWPQIPPSIKVFSNESTLRMRWPKYWSFSFSIRDTFYIAIQYTQRAASRHRQKHRTKTSSYISDPPTLPAEE